MSPVPPQADPPDDGASGADGKAAGGKRPARKGFLLRVAPELMDELRAWANHDLRSLNAHIEFLLREALKRRRGGGDEETEA